MMNPGWLFLTPLALCFALGACKSDDDDDDDDEGGSSSASALISDSSGKKLGTATFTKDGKKVKLVIDLAGVATMGQEVGIHIHQTDKCTGPSDAPFKDAGDHWNPGKAPKDYNGTPETGYLGELGKMAIDAEGKARREWSYEAWKIGTGDDSEDVVGRAIILHAVDPNPADDQAAPRQGCGQVRANEGG